MSADVELVDPANLRDLSVRVLVDTTDDDADRALWTHCYGILDGDHAWLDIAVLRRSGPADDTWRAGFDAMIDRAGVAGWVVDDRVRAHVIRD